MRRRRFALIFATLIGAPLGLALIAMAVVVVVALSGISVDASRWRDAAAQRASAALGRPIVLEGALELEPKLNGELGLRAGQVRILNPSGFTGHEFLAIGDLRARVDLFAALRGRFRSSGIEARDVDLWLERSADGVGNWTSTPRPDSSSRPPAIDIARLSLHRLGIHYVDARPATRRDVELEELSGGVGWDRPLRLAARGRLEAGFPYEVSIEGGPLRLLQDAAETWPFTLQVDALGGRVHASGALAADSVHIGDLRGRLGESDVSGQLTLAFGGARPRLSGALHATALDLRPLLAAQPRAGNEGSASNASGTQALPLRDLAAFDAEIDLKVERWLGPSIDIRDARFAWRADGRGVRVPMSAQVAGVPLAGSLELDTSAPTPTVAFQLDADNAPLGELAAGLGLASGVDGTIGRARLRMNGRGDTTASLARDLEFSLALKAARIRFGGSARADPVSIDTLDLSARRGERLTGRAHGSTSGQRATLSFRGGTVPDMLRDRALPLELDVALAQARLQVQGSLPLAGSTRDTALRFDFRARRAGALAPWLSVAPQANLPLALRGRVRLSDTAWTLDGTTLELGRSQVTIDARSTPGTGRSRVVASVRSTLIDVPELSTLLGSTAGSRARPGGSAPAPSAAADLADADVDFQLKRVRLGRTDFEDLAFVARSRNGRVLPASVTGRVAGASFKADVELDLQAQPPVSNLALSTGAIDIGALLRGLGIAEDIDGRVRSLQVNVLGRGSSLSEWVGQSAIDMQVQGGSLVVSGAARSSLAEIGVDKARIAAMAGERVRATLDGAIGETPLSIEITSGTLADLAGDGSHVPFALTARAAGTHFALDGDVSLPLGSGGQLNLEMRGDRLDSLSELARVELPAWGPWSFRSPIHMTTTGYDLPALHASVGGSRLDGSAALDLGGSRPSLDLRVAAPSVQLDDFPLPQRLTDSPARSDDGRDLRQAAIRMAQRTDKLLSAAFLRRLDANIDVKAKEVLSGGDRLADGAVRLKLDNGHLDIDPAVVNMPGGALRLSISYDLKESQIELGVAAYVERFDYGVIARRFDRTADMRGVLSLDLALFGRAPSLDNITRNASGRVDFAVWPTELSGGMFNLWSVNLLLQLLPLVDPDTRPTVNCIVGRFDLDNGDLSDDKLLIDTSAVRIRGSGHANLATEELEFVFRPRAKGFGLFRLQTPLRVSGNLGDQRFGFKRSDVAESVLRLVASPILAPIEWLTQGPLPRDGADVCTDPMRTGAR